VTASARRRRSIVCPLTARPGVARPHSTADNSAMTHVTRAAESRAIDPARDQSTELAGTVPISPVPSLVLPVPGLVHPHSGSGVEASQVAGGAGLVGNSWASQQLTVDAPVLEVPGGRPRRVGALTIRRFLAPEAIKKVYRIGWMRSRERERITKFGSGSKRNSGRRRLGSPSTRRRKC